MSRSRPPTPLPDGLPEAVRVLLTELRELKERSGYDLRALERRTHASRSSWGRWLSGETWIPADAVRSLADLCGADRRRLEILWEVADQSRRPPSPAPTSEKDTEPSADAPAETDTGRDVQRRGRRRLSFAGAVVGCALVAGSAGVVLGVTLQGTPVAGDDGRQSAPSGEATRPQVAAVTRQQAMARTRAWHPHTPKRVPYDQTANYGGYRTDGSGYASMVLGLPKPGPNSAALEASYCRRVRQSALRPGDLVIKASGGADVREVLIFEKWTGREHTAYWAYQQRRGYGTDHLVSREGLAPGSGHEGCRPYNLHDDQVG
ncbi:helix-turn-helix domain-containing protein [Actinomadura bangladeshensis]|uniref:Helix-turn-helix domain-containing protein n=1 Tax=Actinomadura bangladeshensis TaxID=453573 RepID=A0A6L9QI96_9ACTN|nr:helix-turn-helix transcriptional regulator [Actinomadura bangladeshensis]NEA25177.1 helix-turn-helix domain-containing protein [Actinomadura bangladeshensis]